MPALVFLVGDISARAVRQGCARLAARHERLYAWSL
jgi:hypothetical protein